jgi:hypothetical protein
LTLTGASGTSGQLLTSAGSGSAPTWTTVSADTVGFKNRIINGAMAIDQRNAGATVTPASQDYTLDRFKWILSVASKLSCGQNAGSVTPPVGFKNYLGVTSLSAYTVGTSEQFSLQQHIEGFNTADLNWGTASAKSVTLSFQVYSSLTGTFGGVLRNSAQDRIYVFSYSIPVANTWTTISITIAGDTTGTWLTTSGIGITTSFSMGTGATLSGTAGSWGSTYYTSATGATSVVGTNGATFYITGVQLEKGSTATSFDYRPIGTELALCQRYYETSNVFACGATNINFGTSAPWQYSVTKRAAPTITNGTVTATTNFTTTLASLVSATTTNAYTLFNTNGTGYGSAYCSVQASSEL